MVKKSETWGGVNCTTITGHPLLVKSYGGGEPQNKQNVIHFAYALLRQKVTEYVVMSLQTGVSSNRVQRSSRPVQRQAERGC